MQAPLFPFPKKKYYFSVNRKSSDRYESLIRFSEEMARRCSELPGILPSQSKTDEGKREVIYFSNFKFRRKCVAMDRNVSNLGKIASNIASEAGQNDMLFGSGKLNLIVIDDRHWRKKDE